MNVLENMRIVLFGIWCSLGKKQHKRNSWIRIPHPSHIHADIFTCWCQTLHVYKEDILPEGWQKGTQECQILCENDLQLHVVTRGVILRWLLCCARYTFPMQGIVWGVSPPSCVSYSRTIICLQWTILGILWGLHIFKPHEIVCLIVVNIFYSYFEFIV